jgi:LDH2 family malate/lactate/ureidoglycolate dehydrogenase
LVGTARLLKDKIHITSHESLRLYIRSVFTLCPFYSPFQKIIIATMSGETSHDQPSPKHYVSHTSAESFVRSILEGNGVTSSNALIIAKALVLADLRGVDTHGINRIPSYMTRIRQGVLDATASPTLTKITPVVAQVDGQNSFGFLGAHLGMQTAIEMAREFGIGMVSVKHSNHFGMSAWIVQQAVDANMMSLVFTNSSPALPVWGGKEKLMGVSPIACGAPGGEGGKPFILDMAPSVAARGKIHKAYRRGEKIPLDWALDKDGNRTDDPARALEGVMLPMGGPKGIALSVMMDVFSGVLSGSAFAGHVTGPYDPSKPADVGHFLVAIKPALFMDLGEFRERMGYLYERVVGSERMAGVERIYFPGEIEQLTHEECLRSGIPYVEAEIEALNKEADLVGSKKIEILTQ